MTIRTVTVWKNAEARSRLEAWYARFEARAGVPVEHRQVTTRYGDSHLILAGPPDAPPIVCLHPMRTGAAHLLPELGRLPRDFRVIAPDLPGQSVRGLQVRLPLDDDSVARWLLDVLDALALDRVDLFGVSWGGFAARLTASTAPERVRRLALLVPAGIVNGSHWRGLVGMALPMLRYRLRPSPENLQRVLAPILTTWDDEWARYMADSLRDMRIDPRIPPVATDASLRRLVMPVLVLGASHDISFPGEALVRRVQAVVPHAVGEVIPDCRHCPPTTPVFREWLATRLSAFFAALD